MATSHYLATVLYVVAAIVILTPGYSYRNKQLLFAALNIVSVFIFFFWSRLLVVAPPRMFEFGILTASVLFHWVTINAYNRSDNSDSRWYWIALIFPIVLLIALRGTGWMIVGISYLAFRMSQTAFEMGGDRKLHTSLPEYVAFVIFPPTFFAGPINPLTNYQETSDGRQISLINFSVGLIRIAVGFIKVQFISTLPLQLTFSVLWTEGFKHDWIDFLISGACYYLYLYANFSGYSDIAIGLAGLLGIRVKENFDYPLVARNIKEFWRRWHISLTDFVRDAVFTPLSLTLTRSLGLKHATLAVLIAIGGTFVALSVWHGLAIGYFIFYSLHAVAFMACQLWENYVRGRGREYYRNYLESPFARIAAQILTFLFLSATFSFLDISTWAKIKSAWVSMN
jgi:D-alanyl-lipoteichoic acid acyltransferase DltB (MBOAT superfamily)